MTKRILFQICIQFFTFFFRVYFWPGQDATEMWYSEVSKYNYSRSRASSKEQVSFFILSSFLVANSDLFVFPYFENTRLKRTNKEDSLENEELAHNYGCQHRRTGPTSFIGRLSVFCPNIFSPAHQTWQSHLDSTSRCYGVGGWAGSFVRFRVNNMGNFFAPTWHQFTLLSQTVKASMYCGVFYDSYFEHIQICIHGLCFGGTPLYAKRHFCCVVLYCIVLYWCAVVLCCPCCLFITLYWALSC